MKQPFFTNNTFTYQPRLFGHPHKRPQPQLTEPFWYQYPDWANPEGHAKINPHYHNPIYFPSTFNTAAMDYDHPTLYIGSNTENGRIKAPGSSDKSSSNKSTPKKSNVSPKIDVYANGVFINTMPLRLMTRFSKTVSEAFPRPQVEDEQKGEKSGKVKATEDKKPVDWADVDDEDVDVKKLAAEVAELDTPTKKKKAPAVAPPTDKKSIDLYLGTLYLQPPLHAFDYAFKWMFTAQKTMGGEKPLDYGPYDPDKVTLAQLVDFYAAALVLDLRPSVHRLRGQVLGRITKDKPTPETLEYVHAHLPLEDVTMTRFVTSYFDHRDKGAYSKEELAMIEEYVCSEDPQLHARFMAIGKSRDERAKERQRRWEEVKMQRIAERSQNGYASSGAGKFVGEGNGGEKQSGGHGNGRGGKKQQGGVKANGAKINGAGPGATH